MNISCGLSEVCRLLSLSSNHACQVRFLVVVHSWILTWRCGCAKRCIMEGLGSHEPGLVPAYLSEGLWKDCKTVKSKCEKKGSGYLPWSFTWAYQIICVNAGSLESLELRTAFNFSFCCMLVHFIQVFQISSVRSIWILLSPWQRPRVKLANVSHECSFLLLGRGLTGWVTGVRQKEHGCFIDIEHLWSTHPLKAAPLIPSN